MYWDAYNLYGWAVDNLLGEKFEWKNDSFIKNFNNNSDKGHI